MFLSAMLVAQTYGICSVSTSSTSYLWFDAENAPFRESSPLLVELVFMPKASSVSQSSVGTETFIVLFATSSILNSSATW